MLWKQGEKCPFEIADGIVMDYVEHRFVILIKDDVWSDFERKALTKNKVRLYFLYERVCAIFLLENVDSIDTSDIIFDIQNCEEKDACLEASQYEFEIYLVDKENIICAQRGVTMDKESSKKIQEELKKQAQATYDEDGFANALAKIQGAYEPFEMEDRALVKGVF